MYITIHQTFGVSMGNRNDAKNENDYETHQHTEPRRQTGSADHRAPRRSVRQRQSTAAGVLHPDQRQRVLLRRPAGRLRLDRQIPHLPPRLQQAPGLGRSAPLRRNEPHAGDGERRAIPHARHGQRQSGPHQRLLAALRLEAHRHDGLLLPGVERLLLLPHRQRR